MGGFVAGTGRSEFWLSQCDREVLTALARRGLCAIVVGGRAAQFYGAREVADDLDLFVSVPETGAQLTAALVELGCDVSRYPASRFGEPGMQIPVKHLEFNVDMLTAIPGLQFGEAFARSTAVEAGGILLRILSREDLVHSKRVAGRVVDLEDVRALERDRA